MIKFPHFAIQIDISSTLTHQTEYCVHELISLVYHKNVSGYTEVW